MIRSLIQDILGARDSTLAAHHASITRVSANRRGTRSLITFNEHHWVPTG